MGLLADAPRVNLTDFAEGRELRAAMDPARVGEQPADGEPKSMAYGAGDE
jgi:hypothetical protein